MHGNETIQNWHNRPSVISCWNEAVRASGNGSFSTIRGLFTQESLQSVVVPIPVPRACRITRYAATIVSGGYVGTVSTGFERSTDCGDTFGTAVKDDQAVNEPGETVRFCLCGNVNGLFDRCDVWRPTMTFSPNIFNPSVLLLIHFELR